MSDPFGGAIIDLLRNAENTTGVGDISETIFIPAFGSTPHVGSPKIEIPSVPPSVPTIPVGGIEGIEGSSGDMLCSNKSTLIPMTEPVFSSGQFMGKTFDTVVREYSSLLQKHERSSAIPNVCGGVCNFTGAFAKWFNENYKRNIFLCDRCPWYVYANYVRFPDTDPKYPGALFNDVYYKDPGYFNSIPNSGTYINLRSLYIRRMNRADRFPAGMKNKVAGKTFLQVYQTNPGYFSWIEMCYFGQDQVYFDAVDWYLENKTTLPPPQEKTERNPKVFTESSKIVSPDTIFESGKYRGKTFKAVYDFDPGYFTWLIGNYKGKSPNMEAAIEWYKQIKAQ